MKHFERAVTVVWGVAHFTAAVILLPFAFSFGFITVPIVVNDC